MVFLRKNRKSFAPLNTIDVNQSARTINRNEVLSSENAAVCSFGKNFQFVEQYFFPPTVYLFLRTCIFHRIGLNISTEIQYSNTTVVVKKTIRNLDHYMNIFHVS